MKMRSYKNNFRPFRWATLLTSLLLSTKLIGQTTTAKVRKFSIGPVFDYTWQGTHNVDFGFQPMLLLDAKKDHSNVGLDLTINFLYYNNSTYFTPIAKLRIMPRKRKRFTHLAWFASVGHFFTTIQNKYDHRINPEIGVKWEWFNLSLGGNIPVSTYRDNVTTLYRASFSWNLF